MFGKAKPSQDASRLSERMRKAVERETAPPPATHRLARQVERAVRQAVFRQGALILADGEKLPVALKNISANGARVEFFTRRDLSRNSNSRRTDTARKIARTGGLAARRRCGIGIRDRVTPIAALSDGSVPTDAHYASPKGG